MRSFAVSCALGVFLLGALPAWADIQASADVTPVTPSSDPYKYAINLHNTGTINVSTLWFAWDDSGLNFLPSAPDLLMAPANWFGFFTYTYFPSTFNYTYGIEWYTFTNPVAPGNSLSGFSFESADSPAVLESISGVPTVHPQDSPFPVTTSFVYMNYPAQQPNDNGFQFIAAVPEPATGVLLLLGAAGMLSRRRGR